VTGLDEGIARLGSAVSLQRLAVELERRNHRYDDALTRLDRMQSQFARTETMLALRGDILTEAGRTLEANAAYTEALHLVEERMAHGRVVPATAQLRTDLMHKLSTAEDK
jgi:predicted negative regulator of RcsB-dependent stress response